MSEAVAEKRNIVVDLNRVPADQGFAMLATWGDGKDVDVATMLPMIRLAVQPEYANDLTFLEAFKAMQELSAQLGAITGGVTPKGN